MCTCINGNACRLCPKGCTLYWHHPVLILLKVGDLAQMVKVLVAYWLGTFLKVAGSNPSGSMKQYFHMYNGCWYLIHCYMIQFPFCYLVSTMHSLYMVIWHKYSLTQWALPVNGMDFPCADPLAYTFISWKPNTFQFVTDIENNL